MKNGNDADCRWPMADADGRWLKADGGRRPAEIRVPLSCAAVRRLTPVTTRH